MKSKPVLLGILSLTLAGCSAPLVAPDPPVFQSKMGHATDWSALADRTAERFAEVYGNMTPVYVEPGPADMPFAVAYRSFLEQDLLQRRFTVLETARPMASAQADCTQSGCPIRESVSAPVVLRFGVQTFLYRNGDDKLFPIDYATFWTTLGAIGVQLRNVSSLDTAGAIGAGAGPVLDILASMADTTKAEVVLTLTVSGGDRLLYRDSETVYVHPEELPLYWTHVPDFVPQERQPDIIETALPVRAGRP